ncbi:deoxyhypusine hydroxylase, partial [Modicella reniformis]
YLKDESIVVSQTCELVLEKIKYDNRKEKEALPERHEIAYVFGQMQHPAAVPSLIKVLSNLNEANMVRHEAAEALGSIATPECYPVLGRFRDDKERVVRESCVVALDMYEYENSEQLQYADGLSRRDTTDAM